MYLLNNIKSNIQTTGIITSVFTITWVLTSKECVVKLFNKINLYIFRKFDLNYCWGYYPRLGFIKHYDLDYLLKKEDKRRI